MLLEETESCPEDPKETGDRLWAQRKAQPSRPLMTMWAFFDFTAEVAVRTCLSSLLRLLQTMCLCHQRRKMWEREWNEKIDNVKKMI